MDVMLWNYYINITADSGRAIYSTLRSYMISGKTVMIYKDDPTQVGPIALLRHFS